ncbi:hypothetical protein EJB05_10012, partial [Eragrostis curvula]
MEAVQQVLSAGINIREETQLKVELECLRTTLPKARYLISCGEWGMFKDKGVAELLSQLKDSTYEAEDLLRELDDKELRQKIEDADRTWAGQFLSSSLNLARNFMHGTKTRVKETQNKLDKAVADIEGVLNFMGLNVESVQLMPETSSVISAPQVFGRDEERDELMEKLGVPIGRVDKIDQVIEQLGVPLITKGSEIRSVGSKGKGPVAEGSTMAKRLKTTCSTAGPPATNCTSNVSVLSIYGIGGVGKTMIRGITEEIVESISRGDYKLSCNFNKLRESLLDLLKKCPKFLLVLDDIWPSANNQWEEFYAPFRTGPEGSMILVTTRYPMVADLVTSNNCEPVELKGLPVDIFWELFRKCAFGKNNPEAYPSLQDIGRSISSRLCGSPLAAKTLGRLLNMELTERHWRTIQNSELWELPYRDNEILPALQLSYLYLPQELKRCFAFCSMFPKDYSFKRHEIVNIWVAEGFIAPRGTMRLEDLGIIYLDDLRSRFLYQDDPQFPCERRYVMHDLIHDMAQSISVDECFSMQDRSYQNQRRMTHTIRHLSVEIDGQSLSTMKGFQHLNKLRSLRFGNKVGVEITWFNKLSNILFLSLQGCKLTNLPESICELSSLRYLDISRSSVEELPEKFWCLYSLQVLDANESCLKTIHQDVTKLINLRSLELPEQVSRALSRLNGLGNMPCLQDLKYFRVGKGIGRRIIVLKGMNELSRTLTILSLNNVPSAEEAAEARLFDKLYIKELILRWEDRNVRGQLRAGQNGVVEGLRPHPCIERLQIHGFCGDMFSPTWFRPEDLTTLRSLKLYLCLHLKCLSIPCISSLEELEFYEVGIERLTTLDGIHAGSAGDPRTQNLSGIISSSNGIASFAFTRLTVFRLNKCNKLSNLDQFLTPENLPSVKLIWKSVTVKS